MMRAAVDHDTLERLGASGCSNSDYTFVVTTCCARFGIEDGELHTFYWDAVDLTHKMDLFDDSTCPLCGAAEWNLDAVAIDQAVPEAWLWATAPP